MSGLCWLAFEETSDGGFLIRPGLPAGATWSLESPAHCAALRLLKLADELGQRVPSEDERAEAEGSGT